jgi:hypothetical protein
MKEVEAEEENAVKLLNSIRDCDLHRDPVRIHLDSVGMDQDLWVDIHLKKVCARAVVSRLSSESKLCEEKSMIELMLTPETIRAVWSMGVGVVESP